MILRHGIADRYSPYRAVPQLYSMPNNLTLPRCTEQILELIGFGLAAMSADS